MELDKYPYFKALLISDQGRSCNLPYDTQRVRRLEEALSSWVQAQERGSIENARFQESKETISRAIGHAWRAIPRDTEWIYGLSSPHRQALDGALPTLSTLKGRAKRVQATPDSPDRDQVLALLNEITPLAEAYVFLKANAKKKSTPFA